MNIIDFNKYGSVIYSMNFEIYPYEIKSETAIIIDDNAIYDILHIDDTNLDMNVSTAGYEIHRKMQYKKVADPISDFSSKIIGHWF